MPDGGERDEVNRPARYTFGKYEVFDVLQAYRKGAIREQ
jgi:hypothetical protein